MAEKRLPLTIAISCLIVLVTVLLVIVVFGKGLQKEEPTTTAPAKTTVATTEELPTVLLSEIFDKKYHTEEFRAKQIIGRVSSEELGINCNLVFGTSDECLNLGAGLHKCSSLPGMTTPLNESATCPIIAGHCRTVFVGLSKFDPKNGDFPKGITVTLEMPYGNYTYEITKAEVIKASDFKFSDHRASHDNFEPDTVLIYTCYPFGVVNYVKTDRLFLTGKLIKGDRVVDDTLAKPGAAFSESVASDIG
ncbi:MAG: sortase [Clostridia bacterium]|nr:sortase [Clostridia bacterium]